MVLGQNRILDFPVRIYRPVHFKITADPVQEPVAASTLRGLHAVVHHGYADAFFRQAIDLVKMLVHRMASAAIALNHNGIGAVAPCSGFHHAGYGFGGGFCTFNGLMVAAQDVLTKNAAHKIGILDLDMHWGNGTQDIIDKLGLASQVPHYSQHHRAEEAEVFLDGLAQLMTQQFGDCDLLIYQAGADSHIHDPLGGYLCTAQMHRRDDIVFATCRHLHLPVAWNLAGGYQRDDQNSIRPVLDLHDNTFSSYAQHCLQPTE